MNALIGKIPRVYVNVYLCVLLKMMKKEYIKK